MTLQDIGKMLHKSWTLIVACVLLGAGSAAAYSFLVPPLYVADTQLYISVRATAAAGTADLVQGTAFARQAVTSYVAVVESDIVLDRVISDLKLDLSVEQLDEKITTSSPAESVLIDVSVTHPDAALAANIANSVGRNFAKVIVSELEKPSGSMASPIKVTTIRPAHVPVAPTVPNVPLSIVLGIIAGLAVGIFWAVLRKFLDTRLHSAGDIGSVTQTPILGTLTLDRSARKRPLVVHFDPMSKPAEAYRSLRTNLQFINVDGGPRSFAVTSSIPGEGKSTTVANLAIALAETQLRVALVDADLRRPRIADYLGIEGASGLTDILIGRAELADVLQQWGPNQLFVLPSGSVPPNPSELLGSAAMLRLITELTDQFDIVLIDSPPLLQVTDAVILSQLAGGTLVVVASGVTKRRELEAAASALDRVSSRMVGVILTMVPTKGPDSHAYGQSHYGFEHSAEQPTGATVSARQGAHED